MDGPVGIMLVRGSATVVTGPAASAPGPAGDAARGSGPAAERGPEPANEPLVWLEDGEERPFTPPPEHRRPWLEESAAWGEPGREAPPADQGPKPPDTLIWL